MGRFKVIGQTGLVDSKSVVLAGDHDLTGLKILHRMIAAVVSEFHFDRLRAAGKR
jgi:hypothetical protein